MAPAHKATPPRFAADLTNLSRQSASSSSSSAKRPSPSTTYRQTSLADSRFFHSTPPAPLAPPTSSPTESAAADAPSVFGSDAPPLSDASNTSPVRVEDGACAHDGLDDESDAGSDDDGEPAPGRTKRRRVASHDSVPSRRGAQAWAELGSAQLVGTYGMGDSEGRERMEPTFAALGQQFGAFEAMRRRELGFRAGATRRASLSLFIVSSSQRTSMPRR